MPPYNTKTEKNTRIDALNYIIQWAFLYSLTIHYINTNRSVLVPLSRSSQRTPSPSHSSRGWVIPQGNKLGYNQDYWGVNERAPTHRGGRSPPRAQDQTPQAALPARLPHPPRPQSRTRRLSPSATPRSRPQATVSWEEALGAGVFAGQASDTQKGETVIQNVITHLMIRTISIHSHTDPLLKPERYITAFSVKNRFRIYFSIWIAPLPSSGCSREQLPFAANKILILILMQDKYHRALGLVVREVSLQAFEQYILQSSQSYLQLFRSIREAETQGLPRFNVWRMLLKIMPFEGSWEDKRLALEGSRKRWATVRDEARNGPKIPQAKEAPVMPKNPLMKNIVKPEKKQTDSDPFLLQEIKKDVDRTYQQMEFFQEEPILKLLTNVLFVWCKLNADISYKQGMNELLASVVYVYFQEAIPADYSPNNEIEERFHFLNSLAHAEADIFAVFERIMVIQKFMFKENLDGKIRGEVNPNSKNNSPILQRIIYLQDHKLKALDLQLFRIIKLQDVRTKTFLLRWIRCLHTREFGLFNSLPIWDSILLDALQSPESSQKNEFQFVDAMCLAMFIYMRALVFTRETANEIQQIYQKYPELEGNDLKQLIALAWSVTEELRATSKNAVSQTSNANWFEDTGKSKDLGLMDKGKETIYKSKLGEKKDKGKFQDFAEEQLYPELDAKHESSPEVRKQPTPPPKVDVSPKPQPLHQQVSQQKPRQKVQVHRPSPAKPKRDIIFSQDQIRGLIQSLKRSIALNDDIESRALSNQALHVLEQRLRR